MNPSREAQSRREEEVRRIFTRTAESYERVVNLATLGMDKMWKERMIGICRTRLKSPGKILDLACGTGLLTYRLAALYPDSTIVGLDIMPEYLERARSKADLSNRSRILFRLHNADELESADLKKFGQFDLIITSYLPKYVDVSKLATTCHALLAPHGVLMVQGRIVVNGTANKPAIFSAFDENGAAAGWQGIVLMGSGKKNLIEHCRVEGAETGLDASFSNVTLKNAFFGRCRTGVRMQDSLAVMSGSAFGECGSGLVLYDCEADIRSADFYGNRLGIFAARSSLALSDSRLSGNNLLALKADSCRLGISGNGFIANGSGLCLVASEGAVTANRIAQSAAYGLILTQSRVKVSANDIERNSRVGLLVEDGKGVAWGNLLFANGGYDLYNGGTEDFRAIGNWWGGAVADPAGRIYDRNLDDRRGRVLYLPILQTRPLPVAP